MTIRSLSEVPRLAIGTPEQFGWLYGILKWTIVFNLIDAVLTLVWVQAGLAEEVNHLLRDLVNDRALLFMLAKLGLVSLGSVYLWRLRTTALAVVAIFMSFTVYYLIVLYHLRFSSEILFAAIGF